MKKTYETPVLTELTVGTTDVMLASGDVILSGTESYKCDLDWDLL